MYCFIQLIFDIRRDKTLITKSSGYKSVATLSQHLLNAGESFLMRSLQMAWTIEDSMNDQFNFGTLDASVVEAIRVKAQDQDRSGTRSQLRQIMFRIAESYSVYPSTMIITGVSRGDDAIDGGGYGGSTKTRSSL